MRTEKHEINTPGRKARDKMKLAVVATMIMVAVIVMNGCGGGGSGAPSVAGGGGGGGGTTASNTVASVNGTAYAPAGVTAAREAGRDAAATIQASPMAGATVTLNKMNADGSISPIAGFSTTTDSVGHFSLAGVPKGDNYIVVVSKTATVNGVASTITLRNTVSVTDADLKTGAVTEDIDAVTTLAVQCLRDEVAEINLGQAQADWLDGSQVPPEELAAIESELKSSVLQDVMSGMPVLDFVKATTGTETEIETELNDLRNSNVGMGLDEAETSAKTESHVRVIVTTSSGDPVPDASVMYDLSTVASAMKTQGGGTDAARVANAMAATNVMTNKAGVAFLSGVAPGSTVTVTAVKPGFTMVTGTVTAPKKGLAVTCPLIIGGTQMTGVTRTYYIAAVDVNWDYTPMGIDNITGQPYSAMDLTWVQQVMVIPPASILTGRIGHIYKKTRFVEFTDATFTVVKATDPKWAHLGIMGPMIRAEVGDTIVVHFKNMTTGGRPFGVHPHGVFYNKNSEGADYNDGTIGTDKGDGDVLPGGTWDYTWYVPERAGPTMMEGSSTGWAYHSHANEPRDENSGLIGPMIVTRKGMAKPDGSPVDVDVEIVMAYKVFDENISFWIDNNVATYTGVTAPADIATLEADPDFIESNKMHSINGISFGNNAQYYTMKKGQRVRWYISSFGTEFDLHTPHWHGNTVVINGMRTDVASVLPMEMVVADMKPDDVGTWRIHCHVNDHITAGMDTMYTVTP